MTNIKKRLCLLTALVLLCTAVLGGCGSEENSSGPFDAGEATYTVTVTDLLGNIYPSGIIVKFMQNGEQIAMQPCNENGVAEKKLPEGEYTVELDFTGDANAYYYKPGQTLTAENNSAEVKLANKITAEAALLTTQTGEYDAYSISTGCTYVELDGGHRNYFLFVPTVAGLYEFSVPEGANAKIGYYGAPHYVQENAAVAVTDNKFSISINAGMIGTAEGGTVTMVIGIDAEGDESCIIGIQRVGDPIKTIEDEPWDIYEATIDLAPYTLPDGAEIKEFDLTADTDAYNLVLNEEDGFYHIGDANGPLVLVRLATDSDYLDCFETMLAYSGVTRYFFDENGDFVKKESYSECLLEYIECVDENEGVYPMTEDLKYIIQQRGEYVGWWNPESASYMFKDIDGNIIPDINNEIAWLLMSCYIE